MGSYLDIARQALELLAVPIPAAADSNRAAADAVGNSLAATAFADWVCRPDAHGRMGWEPEAAPFDDLDLPGPGCPMCRSLEQWQDALGRQRCGRCEADALGKALQLAERAARLRKQAQSKKPARHDCAPCVAAGRVDMQDLGDKQPA